MNPRSLSALVSRLASLALLLVSACASVSANPRGPSGPLLVIGGGLDNESAPIGRRFVQLARPAGAPVARPALELRVVPIAEPGQNRQLALWRLFRTAEREPLQRLALEGFEVLAWPAGDGEVAFELVPRSP
jgi:hypothetical protein